MNSPAVRLHQRHASSDWLLFVVWAAVGFAIGFGVLVVGPLALVLLVAAVGLLMFVDSLRLGAFGLLPGLGAVSLIVAYVQRKGPGTVYWRTAGASGSIQYLDPRPWLAAGIVLVLLGVGLQARRGRARNET
jgi:hypothetical protein